MIFAVGAALVVNLLHVYIINQFKIVMDINGPAIFKKKKGKKYLNGSLGLCTLTFVTYDKKTFFGLAFEDHSVHI